MALRIARTHAGRTFTIQDREGHPRTIVADEDGVLQILSNTGRIMDDRGNVVSVLTVDGVDGQPDRHLIVFPNEIPDDLQEFVVKVGRTQAVPARYVRGLHGEKELVLVEGDLAEDVLADTSLGFLVRKEADLDAQEGSEDVSETEAQEEE